PSATPTQTPIPPSPTLTATVPTATNTPPPSPTPSITPKPTPFYAEIAVSKEFGGAWIRSEPSFNGPKLTSLVNGSVVEILDPAPSFDEESNYYWLHIRFVNEEGQEQDGWIIEGLLLISTPSPIW
ncbi:MAG: SH3 domain-containing protein, partial [Anaerolineales bacterium]